MNWIVTWLRKKKIFKIYNRFCAGSNWFNAHIDYNVIFGTDVCISDIWLKWMHFMVFFRAITEFHINKNKCSKQSFLISVASAIVVAVTVVIVPLHINLWMLDAMVLCMKAHNIFWAKFSLIIKWDEMYERNCRLPIRYAKSILSYRHVRCTCMALYVCECVCAWMKKLKRGCGWPCKVKISLWAQRERINDVNLA